MFSGNPLSQNCFKAQKRDFSGGNMKQPVVTFEQLISTFPRITNKSRVFAQKILPLYSSPELAALVAALMTDGHVDWYTRDGRPRARKIILYSSEKEECEWFLRIVRSLFGTEGHVQPYRPNCSYFKKQPYKAVVWNAAVARILILAGAPAGNKTEKEFLVPNWIMNGGDAVKRNFLKALFTFEGSKPRRRLRSCSFQIDLCMVKKDEFLSNGLRFLSQIGELLKAFGVNTCKIGYYAKRKGLKKANHVFHFSIMQQISIINFYRNIGYFKGEKQRLLKKAVFEIAKSGRIREKPACNLIAEMKDVFGTDRKLAAEINKYTENSYTNRQMEHFRRNETALPLEFLWALIKIREGKAILGELPAYVTFLYELKP